MNIFKKKEVEKEDDIIRCDKCKCLLHKEDAQEIKYFGANYTVEYYCQKCRKPYDFKCYYHSSEKLVIRYYKITTIEVDEDGQEIKIKK